MKITIGSRGSQLALWQARWVAARLEELGAEVSIEIIKTTGDRITDVPLAKVGGKGLFTKEIEEALLEGRVDCAVHSLKDLPTVLPEGLTVAAIPEREVAWDALVGSTLAGLREGARVGTSSLRRSAQLRRLRPDVVMAPVRGNLDTRLRKLDEGEYDAILLAAAGLRRLGWGERVAEMLAPDVMCPAVGQGALAIETRDDGGGAWALCGKLDDGKTRAEVTAERALLAALGGGCQVPIGAHARCEDGVVRLRSVVIHPDGAPYYEDLIEGAAGDAAEMGRAAAVRLLEAGARGVLRSVYGGDLPLTGERVIVTRARRQAGRLASLLRSLGAETVELPAIEFEALDFDGPEWGDYDWVVFTSANAVEFFFERAAACGAGVRVCAIGPATAAALAERGIAVTVVADESVAEGVVEALRGEEMAGKRVLLPRAEQAREVVPEALRAAGARVDVVAVYRTLAPAGLAEAWRAVAGGGGRMWVVLTSSSTARNVVAAAGVEGLRGARIASLGPVTSATVRSLGLEVEVEAAEASGDALAGAIVERVKRDADSQRTGRG